MKVTTNIGNPPEKKKTKTVYRKEGPAPKSGNKTTVSTSITAGKEKSTYTPARAMTGDKRYGKESSSNPDPGFVQDARKNKQDIAFDKGGKPYRAGTTMTTSTPPRMNVDVKIGDQDLRPVVRKEVEVKEKKKPGKLKAMAMTYGTDSPTGGGTKYKNRVSPR